MLLLLPSNHLLVHANLIWNLSAFWTILSVVTLHTTSPAYSIHWKVCVIRIPFSYVFKLLSADLLFLAESRFMTIQPTSVASELTRTFLSLLLTSYFQFRLIYKVLFSVEISYSWKINILRVYHTFNVLKLTVRSFRTETQRVIITYLSLHKLIWSNLSLSFMTKLALSSQLAESPFKIRATKSFFNIES